MENKLKLKAQWQCCGPFFNPSKEAEAEDLSKELEASFRTARAAKRKPVSKDENKYHLIDRSIIFCLVG